MVDWTRFNPADLEYDFYNDKLGAHKVTLKKLLNVFFRILKFEEIKHSKTVINFIARQLEGENSKLFFNLNRVLLSG